MTFADLPHSKSGAHSQAFGPEWLDYCRGRERVERAAAKSAGSALARQIHQQLAQAYADAVRQATGTRP